MQALQSCSTFWNRIQRSLFGSLEQELGPLTEKQQKLISTLEMIRVESFIPSTGPYCEGRPLKDRAAIARALVAKSIYDMPTTRVLLERLSTDRALRQICGWERKSEVPSESVFSRAFSKLAASKLLERVHEALIQNTYQDHLVGHISRDATAIEAREKPLQKTTVLPNPCDVIEAEPKQKPKRGRPRKGEERPQEPTRRLERQQTMTKEEMLADLPKDCDVGTKKDSHGKKKSWTGFKLHLDVADGQIPISCILTSASTHDSQVAIPLAALSGERVTNLYDVMDAAYDAQEIRDDSKKRNHVPLIDINPRRDAEKKEELQAETQRRSILGLKFPEDIRYNERTTVERVNARLKDEFGGRYVRVRGHAKVMCHLMFGILALTADQLARCIR